jgi:hypothetical protein
VRASGVGHYKLSTASPLRDAALDRADIGCNLRSVWGKEDEARSGRSDDAEAGDA